MMENKFDNHNADYYEKGNDIYSKVVRAGKRTYFFDVKITRRDDFYITITESKRQVNEDGGFSYEKHKIFLYKEDFDKFVFELLDVVNFINEKVNVGGPILESIDVTEELD